MIQVPHANIACVVCSIMLLSFTVVYFQQLVGIEWFHISTIIPIMYSHGKVQYILCQFETRHDQYLVYNFPKSSTTNDGIKLALILEH